MTYTKPFETVYSHYPLKKGKFQAMKTWSKLYGELPDPEVMINAIAAQKKERSFLKRQNRFCPSWKHFSTWLNGKCWEDDCELDLQAERIRTNIIEQTSGIQNLTRAFNILTNLGEKEFYQFCRHTKMPPEDIEAVENKHRMSFSVNQLANGMLQGV